VRSLEVGALNLSLGSLKSLTHSLHSGLSNLLTWAEISTTIEYVYSIGPPGRYHLYDTKKEFLLVSAISN
jgi:hypothetical protein